MNAKALVSLTMLVQRHRKKIREGRVMVQIHQKSDPTTTKMSRAMMDDGDFLVSVSGQNS
jgi:hypothetical protein